jgi:hypothetical protein
MLIVEGSTPSQASILRVRNSAHALKEGGEAMGDNGVSNWPEDDMMAFKADASGRSLNVVHAIRGHVETSKALEPKFRPEGACRGARTKMFAR